MGETPAEVHDAIGRRLLLAQIKDATRIPERDDGWQLTLLDQGEVPSCVNAQQGRLLRWIEVEGESAGTPKLKSRNAPSHSI